MEKFIETWDKFVDWYWPHFVRNNTVLAVVVGILIVVAKTFG